MLSPTLPLILNKDETERSTRWFLVQTQSISKLTILTAVHGLIELWLKKRNGDSAVNRRWVSIKRRLLWLPGLPGHLNINSPLCLDHQSSSDCLRLLTLFHFTTTNTACSKSLVACAVDCHSQRTNGKDSFKTLILIRPYGESN
jgi:hypothetical protein